MHFKLTQCRLHPHLRDRQLASRSPILLRLWMHCVQPLRFASASTLSHSLSIDSFGLLPILTLLHLLLFAALMSLARALTAVIVPHLSLDIFDGSQFISRRITHALLMFDLASAPCSVLVSYAFSQTHAVQRQSLCPDDARPQSPLLHCSSLVPHSHFSPSPFAAADPSWS